ncbi:helix-turn-helix domain-containing protein [Micromonospora sp. STR1_7]|uniref:Helix-turn-helix domain-containing protein n=1 Tax=Micromonospora parastrephiae TaxID=2806101 RepID=A0ABS1XUD9_9ACTN|nr:helix-turn-helix domain-containing protein [Micromonospora parastrephiae]MBM0232883.1 helix-turn-helix domain-containing protein [Micromonospora parastrephiae]
MSDRRALASTNEVADFLVLPVRTVEDWRRSGRGPKFSRVGKHVRYRWADVEKWLDDQAGAKAA